MTSKDYAVLSDKTERDEKLAADLEMGLPAQIIALRQNRGWSRAELAKRIGVTQPRIAAIEQPGEGRFTLATLLRLASVFDVALEVRFVPFSQFFDISQKTSDDLTVPRFDEDPGLREYAECHQRDA